MNNLGQYYTPMDTQLDESNFSNIENIAAFFESLPVEDLNNLQKGDFLINRQYGLPGGGWGGYVEYVQNDEAWVKTKKGTKKVNIKKSAWELKRIKKKPIQAKKEIPAAIEPPEAPETPEEPEIPATPDIPEEPETPATPDSQAAETFRGDGIYQEKANMALLVFNDDNEPIVKGRFLGEEDSMEFMESDLEEDLSEKEKEAAALSLNQYNPVNSNTIVINKMEFNSGIKGVTNYKDWATKKSVIHNRKAKKYREPFDIIHLVLHETAGDTGDGFDASGDNNAHLSIKKDASVLQFNDLVELQNHGIGMNTTGIGIEFVNRAWLSSSFKNGGEGIPGLIENLSDVQKEKYKESKGFLWAFWGNGFNIYRLPTSLDQLEKEVELVKWITEGLQMEIQKIKGISIYNLFPWIDQDWLQSVSYNEVKDIWTFKTAQIPALLEQDTKNLFVMTTGYEFLVPNKIKSKSGIISHNAFYEDHSDGSFLSLYTWLRIKKIKTKTQAYNISKSLMKNHFIRVSLKSDPSKKIILLDVRDINLTDPTLQPKTEENFDE